MSGVIGQILVLFGFVVCALAGYAYLQAARTGNSEWRWIGRAAWGAMTASLAAAAVILMVLLLTHQFQYSYVYQQTSRALPTHFLVSSFWAGQEGSFLLWILLMSALGLVLMRTKRAWEAPVMAIVAGSQWFLISMISGLQLGPLRIGASPFATLAEKFPDAPMLQIPGFIPADGSGLNDLLQNYWMVIHPPTLFLGFTLMAVPFAFAVAALWKRRYTEWIPQALPWALVATAVLGVGITMGGYWAYETLSFGGYWAWDPVENSSLVPWLTGIAAVHTMIIRKRSGRGHKSTFLFCILSYMLVIYSTFLTRSGILGDISVHSFVDLGMMNQLLLWILAMGVVGFGLFAYRYRELPAPDREPHLLSREFMTFCGALLLACLAAVVTVGTSSPILGKLFREAPSTVPIDFYNKWTLPISILLVFLAGLGQLFWWHRMDVEQVNRVLIKPIAGAVASTVAVLIFTPFVAETVQRPDFSASGLSPAGPAQDVSQAGFGAGGGFLEGIQHFGEVYGTGILLLLLVFMAFFALYGNGMVLWKVGRGNPRMAGGATAHVGFAIMVLAIVASSGFSKPIGAVRGVPIEDGRDSFVLERGQTRMIGGYQVTYSGRERTARNRPVYVLDFIDPNGREFTVRPVVYKSDQAQWIQHPDHEMYPDKDIFVAVSPRVMQEDARASGDDPANPVARQGELTISRGDSTVVGDDEFAIQFINYQTDLADLPDSTEIGVAALLDVTHLETGETRRLSPVYLIMQDRTQQYIQNRVSDWGLTVTFTGMNVDTGSIRLFLEGVAVEADDWLIVQAYEKPLINFLWFGFLLLTGGFGFAAYRRYADNRHSARRAARTSGAGDAS
ncbi:MAG: cytochrome C assembly protein [Bacteroidetes bacterium SB0662_bin_6]|nr:cytochrome C assembly protein [Bacteroidetes bacterium SB0668_bin_1]MYE04629.1 cytochrome C assembly protein [Bacteroidetes bacterium SB0662_bin_6]